MAEGPSPWGIRYIVRFCNEVPYNERSPVAHVYVRQGQGEFFDLVQAFR
jgi:hypothetical protein